MAAIPVIAAGVSAVGTLSSMAQQNRQANAQAAGIANERTTAIINAEIQRATIDQQDKIGGLQNELAQMKNEKDAALAASTANLQREQFSVQQYSNRVAIEQQRMIASMVTQQARASVQQQTTQAGTQVVNQESQVQGEIANAQSTLTLGEQAMNMSAMLRNTRGLNAMGKSAENGQLGFVDQEVSALQATMQDLANEGNRVTRETTNSLGIIDEVANAEQSAITGQQAERTQQLGEAESMVNRQDLAADSVLQDYLANLNVLKSSMGTDTNFNESLRQQQVISQQRAAREGLASNMTALDAQASMIQRPGVMDLIQGGFNVFNTFNSLNERQQSLQAARSQPSNVRQPNQSDYQNPRFNPNAGVPRDSFDPGINRSGAAVFSSGIPFSDPTYNNFVPIEVNPNRGMTLDQMVSLTRNRVASPNRVIEFKAPGVR